MATNLQTLWSRDFILACLANFLMSFSFYLLMPTLPLYLTKVLNLPESNVGVVLSSYTLAMLLARPFSGFLVDNFNRKLLFMISLSMFSFFYGGYLLAGTVFTFMILRFIHGATWGITSVSGNTIAIDIIPSSRRAQGIGFYGLNMNLSMAIAPWVGLQIYNSVGYTALILSCLLAGYSALAIVSFMKVRPRPKVESSAISLDRFILVRALPITVNLMLCSISYGMIISYGALYAEEIHIKHTGLLFLFMAVGIGMSRVISGRYVDKGYMHQIAISSIVLLACTLFMFSLVHNVYAFCIASLFIGIGFGSMVPAFQTLFVNMAHNNQRGTANSTYLTSFDLGIGFGMLLGGVISDGHNLNAAYIVGGTLCLISVPYYYFVTQPLYERKKVLQE